jgi:hypothetical protein
MLPWSILPLAKYRMTLTKAIAYQAINLLFKNQTCAKIS